MQTNTHPVPSALKYLQVILFSAVILYFGKTLFIPIFFGLLIAIVMYPICRWLEGHRWTRALAITACLLIVTILFKALFALLIWQIEVFSKDAPAIVIRAEATIQALQARLIENFGASAGLQNNWGEKLTGSMAEYCNPLFKLL